MLQETTTIKFVIKKERNGNSFQEIYFITKLQLKKSLVSFLSITITNKFYKFIFTFTCGCFSSGYLSYISNLKFAELVLGVCLPIFATESFPGNL